MKGILLAAGLGSRLRPLTLTTPKCLIPINGRPLLDYWLERLFSGGMKRVLINTHYLSDQVESFVKNSQWVKKVDLVNEEKILGTGGTLVKNFSYLKGESFFVAHADNLVSFNLEEFQKFHEISVKKFQTQITMMSFISDNPSSCGIVNVDHNDIVKEFFEKVPNPPGNLANGAVFIFEPSVLDFMKKLRIDNMDISKDVLPNFIGKIIIYRNTNYLRDIGNIESLARAEGDVISFPSLFE